MNRGAVSRRRSRFFKRLRCHFRTSGHRPVPIAELSLLAATNNPAERQLRQVERLDAAERFLHSDARTNIEQNSGFGKKKPNLWKNSKASIAAKESENRRPRRVPLLGRRSYCDIST